MIRKANILTGWSPNFGPALFPSPIHACMHANTHSLKRIVARLGWHQRLTISSSVGWMISCSSLETFPACFPKLVRHATSPAFNLHRLQPLCSIFTKHTSHIVFIDHGNDVGNVGYLRRSHKQNKRIVLLFLKWSSYLNGVTTVLPPGTSVCVCVFPRNHLLIKSCIVLIMRFLLFVTLLPLSAQATAAFTISLLVLFILNQQQTRHDFLYRSYFYI